MCIIRSTLKYVSVVAALAIAGGAMASSVVHHHRGFGSSDACFSSQSAICLAFYGDNSFTTPISVTDSYTAVEGGRPFHDSDKLMIGNNASWSTELDISDIKSHKLTGYNEYISSVLGKSVDHLCDVNLTAQDLQTPRQITMTLHSDGAGHYSCQRS